MRMRGERLRVFSGTAHPKLAQDICSFMGVPLGAASLQRFPDAEINLKVDATKPNPKITVECTEKL